MPGGYGTYGPWGSAGETYSQPEPWGGQTSGGVQSPVNNTVADAINVAKAAPPQLSFSQDLQNKAKLAIAGQNPPPPTTAYEDVFEPYDIHQDMAKGFGSVFGASSGSTGSSQTVQDALTFMIDQEVQKIADDQGYTTSSDIQNAIDAAYENFYPKIDQMTLGEFIEEGGTEADYIASMAAMAPGYANLMGYDPTKAGHTTMADQYYNNWLDSQNYGWDSWTDPWNGGWNFGSVDDSMAERARDYWFSESLADVTARQEERRKAGLGPAGMRASEMEQMYDRDFAAKADPHHDPGYSQAVTEELDPMYASRLLWERART